MNSSQSGSVQSMNGLNEISADDITTTTIVADRLIINLAAKGPTPAVGDSSTSLATTAFVTAYASSASFVTLGNPLQTITGDKTFSGVVLVPTASTATSNTQVASTAYVKNSIVGYAPLTGCVFTGSVSGVTPSSTDNSTAFATTAYTKTNLANYQLTSAMSSYAPLTGCVFTGSVSGITASTADTSTLFATTAFTRNNLANYQPTSGMSAYATTAAVTSALSAYATTSYVTTTLSGYQQISGMNSYATLAGCTFTGAVSGLTASTADTSTLFATTAFTRNNLANYQPTSGMSAYATNAAVTSTLSAYATTVAVTTALSGYLPTTGSAAKVNVTDGNTSANNGFFTLSNTASYPFSTSTATSTQLFSDSSLYYNSSLKALTCPNFYGNINGSSTKSSLTLDNASTLGYLTFALNTGVAGLRCSSNVTINPSTSTISATSFDTGTTSTPSLFPSVTTLTANILTNQTTGTTNICTSQSAGGVINIGSASSIVNLKAGAFSTNNGLFYPNTTGPNFLLATSSAQNFNIGSSGSAMNQYYTYIGSSYSFYITIPAPTAAYTGINLVFRRLNSSSSSPIGLQTVGGGSVLVPLAAIVPQAVIALQSINVASVVCMLISSGTYIWAQIF